MRFILSIVVAMPLVAVGVAAGQSRPSERDIACQLGAAECATPAARPAADAEDDGSMVVDGGQRPFCLPGMACARGAPPPVRPVQRAVTAGPRPDLSPGRGRAMDRGYRAGRTAAPMPATGAHRPIGTADMALTFANNSTDLSADAKTRIATFARVLTSGSLGSASFRIDGHTNSVGTRQANQDLSRRRAQAVVDYLASLGVSRDRLQAEGHGFDTPLSGTRPQDPANRRVEIVKK
jgi:outer membrane protein OmpA-like peptidoglycan-associated protein